MFLEEIIVNVDIYASRSVCVKLLTISRNEQLMKHNPTSEVEESGSFGCYSTLFTPKRRQSQRDDIAVKAVYDYETTR